MANNINDNIDNGTRTARNFDINSADFSSIFSEAKTKDTYASVLKNFKRRISEAEENMKKSYEALATVREKTAQEMSNWVDTLADLEEQKAQAEADGNNLLANQLRAQIAKINQRISTHQTTISNLESAALDREAAYNAVIEQYRMADQRMEEQYGASLSAFAEIQEISSEAKENLENLKTANNAIRASMNKTKNDIKELEAELFELEYANSEKARNLRQQISELREELSELEDKRTSNSKEQKATRSMLSRMGINQKGEAEEEGGGLSDALGAAKGVAAGARLGARFGPWGAAIGGLAGGLFSGLGSGKSVGQSVGAAYEEGQEEGIIPEQLENIVGELGPLGKILSTADSILEVASIIKNTVTKYIDQAAEQMKSYYGAIVANLEQSAYNYKDISEKADNILSTSRWVEQTKYLSKIAEVSNAGLLRDIETAAILETIKDKTLTQFDATNEGIQRLIRLNESDYIRQFGIEAQLKKVLNSVFNDSGYLKSMFDSVTSAITDAASMYSGDVTAFNSTVQTWMGFMYSSGLSSTVINKIAEGINNLGSGNLSALAGDEQTQRLFLLAMDRVNMDYADVLQQGLSLDDTNTLLGSIVKYLDEIVNDTSGNNVLRSSYANLFNLSVSDMRAIHQLSSQASSIGNYAIGSGGAMTQTVNALTNTLQQATSASEEFDNLINNIQYTIGESIAESPALYSVYRVSSETIKALESFASISGGVGTLARAGIKIAAIPQYPIAAVALINGLKEAGTSVFNNIFNGGLTSFLTSSLAGDINAADNSTLTQLVAKSNSSSASSNKITTLSRKSLTSGGLTTMTNTVTQAELEADEEEKVEVTILKELAKTLMKTKEEGHYAFAVSLEGMNNNVLKSFASIFADEDAMEKTFTGGNEVIKDSLFNYLGDSTSNTSTADAAKTAANNAAKQGNTSSKTNGKKSKKK